MTDPNRWLQRAPDQHLSNERVRLLRKAQRQSEVRRRRTVGNNFTSLTGGTTPRQCFISLPMQRLIYHKSELVRACVDTLIEFMSAVDWTIRPIDEEKSLWLKSNRPDEYVEQQKRAAWLKKFFRNPNAFEDYDTFQRRLLRDLLIHDAAGYEIVGLPQRNGGKLPIEIGTLPGETIEIETDDCGMAVSYSQSYNVRTRVDFEVDEVAYLSLNPCSWQPYGISPIETAYISIATDLEANKYNFGYFSKNGIPPGLLAVLGVSPAEYRNLTAQLRTAQQDNPHNIHSFRAQRNPDGGAQKVFEYIPLTQQTNRDMQFTELLTLCVNRVCMLYKVTPSQIGFTEQVAGGIGSGVSETQENLSQNKGVAPLMKRVSSVHTQAVIHGTCGWDDLEFAFTESNTPQERQEYENDQKEVQSGIMTINEFRSKHGGRKAVGWGDLPLVQPQSWQAPQSPQMLQQQGVGMGTDSQPQPGMPPMQKAAKKIIIDF